MESIATEPEPVSATYHVFISHRGPDVKKTLASFIYHRLTNCHGLRVFLDQKELQTGDALSPAILGAIESASVHIAIFSKRYAESRWCLDELCWILRCNRKIIPVFYDVEPTDLRYIDSERGCYRKTFEEHQLKGRVGMEDIKKWKAALNKASEISGLLFKTNESDHGEVLEEIVEAVLEGVNREPLEVGKYLVGLDPAVREIDDEIKKQRELNGTVIVGIAGMAGVGKSTLVAYLYNLKRSAFTRFCFLSDVRKKDLSSLQRKLLRDLLGCDFHVEDTRHGKGIFRDRLRGLQVLIVLDDVDHIEQISDLLVTDVVGSRSLILITSRDQDLLRRSSPKTVVYNLKPLQTEHAQELFCRHAFGQSEPYEGFECLVAEVLKICGGLPLYLQVLGGLFLGRHDEKYWKRQLERFSKRLPEDIVDTLKVSYEALNSEEKEIFLDIGCFLVGEEKEVAVRVFEGLGYTDVCDCLENLRQKFLVEFYDEVQDDQMLSGPKRVDYPVSDPDRIYDYVHLPKTEKITMHEHIRQLARHIAREEFGVLPTRNPLRLGCSKDVEELMLKLQGGADSCLIRGIRTPKGEHLPDCTNYIKGVGVRLFVVEVPIDLSTLFGMWDMSGDLVWLRLRSFSSIYFPDTVSLRNLRVLELEGHGDLEQFFQRFNMASTSHENLSTAFLSGTVGSGIVGNSLTFRPLYPEVYEVRRGIYSIAGKFNLRVVDVDFDVDFAGYSSEFHTKMEDFESYGATLMCFLTFHPPSHWYGHNLFDVRFEASDDGVSVDEFKMVVEYPPSGGGSELYFHILMWTEECNLFSADKGYNNICVSHRSWWGGPVDNVAGGWIMMVDKGTKVSQVCKEIIMALS